MTIFNFDPDAVIDHELYETWDPRDAVTEAECVTSLERDHQPRERDVPCRQCRARTWNVSAVCGRCEALATGGAS